MTWLAILGLALLALAPLGWVVSRPARLRGRGEADRALYASQRAEIDREFAEGRMTAEAHPAALLELQRRLLAAPPVMPETAAAPRRDARPLLVILALVPMAAVLLYLVGGVPDMPSAPYTTRQAEAAQTERLIARLRERLAEHPPGSDARRQGLLLLGHAERARGRGAEAAAAWAQALAIRFDAGMAGDLAEMEIDRGAIDAAERWLVQALADQPSDARLRYLLGLAAARDGRPAAARSIWVPLLADAPADAPWRGAVDAQLRALP